MFAIALLLYVAGLLIGSYSGLFASSRQATATGLAIARGGPFAGTIFVLFGLWLARSGWRASIPQSIALILIGLAVHLLEAYLLGVAHMGELAGFDFLIGTLALGGGTFCLALHLPSSHVIVRTLAKLGRYTLGIYAVHLLFVHALLAVLSPENLLAKFSISILVLICSTLLVLTLARLKSAQFLLT